MEKELTEQCTGPSLYFLVGILRVSAAHSIRAEQGQKKSADGDRFLDQSPRLALYPRCNGAGRLTDYLMHTYSDVLAHWLP